MPAAPWRSPGRSAIRPEKCMALMRAQRRCSLRAATLQPALEWARQAQQIDPASIPGLGCAKMRHRLGACADRSRAGQRRPASCADVLAMARAAGDLWRPGDFHELIVDMDLPDRPHRRAGVHLREASGSPPKPVTGSAWSTAWTTAGTCAPRRSAGRKPSRCGRRTPPTMRPIGAARTAARRAPPPRAAARGRAQALGPARTRAAEERGAAMTLAHRRRVRHHAHRPGPQPEPSAPPAGEASSAPGNRNWSPWSPAATPTPRSPASCTSASAPSAPTWTASATRAAAGAAPT